MVLFYIHSITIYHIGLVYVICMFVITEIFGATNNGNYFSELHVMMKRKEQVVEFTGDALVLQHAKVALLVSVLAVISAAFQIAVARLVLTLQTMPKLDSSFILYAIFYFLTC